MPLTFLPERSILIEGQWEAASKGGTMNQEKPLIITGGLTEDELKRLLDTLSSAGKSARLHVSYLWS